MSNSRSKLHYKLAKNAVLLALVLGLLISGSQVFYDLINERNRIDQYVTDILKSTRSAAVDAAYELDTFYSQSIVDGLVEYEAIANISIYDDRNNLLAFAGIPTDKLEIDWISNFIIDAQDTYRTTLIKLETAETVGYFSAVVNANVLGNNFLTRAKVVFISGFIRSMILMLIFLILFYFVLSRPLLKTIREISQIDDAENNSSENFGFSLMDRNDELGELVESFLSLLTRRKQAEEKLRHMAFHDALTNLPNRALLLDRLTQTNLSAERNKFYGALIFLDLDNFKNINDALGHPAGDKLICQAGTRLKEEFRAEDTVGRLGGDEFIVLLPNLGITLEDAELKAHEQAQKILHCFSKPYPLNGQELIVKPSIGITMFPLKNSNSDDLLKQADTAMYQAKMNGGNNYRFYQDDMQQQVNNRLSIEKELRQALINDEFVLHYQPQCNSIGEVIGAEALVRWIHPVRGLISPAEFIYIAEASGLIIALGEWVLKTACNDVKLLTESRGSSINRISVNVSALQFYQENFVDEVKRVLSETGADPHLLTLEVTESIMIGKIQETIAKLEALQAIGIDFSIDDFGTGYSSLQYLQHLPFNELKIDRSFIKNIKSSKSESAIVTTMIAMARNLNMRVVSEGVETRKQLNFLKKKGCELYQGFYFSKPLPITEFKRLKINHQGEDIALLKRSL